MKIVIVGGGFGGLSVATTLSRRMRQLPSDTQVTVIDAAAYHVFTPLLYEVATAYIPGDEPQRNEILASVEAGSTLPYTWLFDRLHERVQFQQARVDRIDVVKKNVVCANGVVIPYDALVMAAGAVSADFGVSGVREHALPLRTMEHARTIRARIERCVRKAQHIPQHITVVGGGPVGVEFAAECAGLIKHLKKEHQVVHPLSIRLLHAQDRLLSMIHPSLSQKALQRLESLGVSVQRQVRVVRVGATSVEVLDTCASNSVAASDIDDIRSMRSHLTVWAAGNQACSLSDQMGTYVSHGAANTLTVASTLEVQGLNDVFALGDIASVPARGGTQHYGPMGASEPSSEAIAPWLAQAAMHQGVFLARNLARWLWARPLMVYRSPSVWASAFPLGGAYALFQWRAIRLSGRLGFIARAIADMNYFSRVLPLRRAMSRWRRGYRVYQRNN